MLEDLLQLHWLGILAGAAAYFFIGALWYSPVLFAKPWMKYVNLNMGDPDAKKGMAAMMIASFVLMFINAIGISMLTQHLPAAGLAGTVVHGLVFGICFSVTAMSINYLYTRKPLGLYFIDGGYHVAGILASSIVIWAIG